jgi:hypothetical protein
MQLTKNISNKCTKIEHHFLDFGHHVLVFLGAGVAVEIQDALKYNTRPRSRRTLILEGTFVFHKVVQPLSSDSDGPELPSK